MQGTKIILLEMVVVVLLLSSCTSASMHGVVAYDSFPKEISLKADSVPTQKVYDNVFVALNEGKFIVSSFKADTMMHFYSIPDLKYDYSLGVKGHGNNELQSFPTFCRSMQSELYVRGYTNHTIKKMSLVNNKLVEKKQFELFLSDVPNDMYMMGDSLLYYNDLIHNEIKCYSIAQKDDCMSRSLQDLCGKVRNNEVLIGSLCMDDSLAAYAFQYRHEIVVLHSDDLAYDKTVCWDYENQDYLVGKRDKSPCLYYTDGYVTSCGFYFLCRNGRSYDRNVNYCIEVYDKKLIPVCKYVLNRKIFKFVIDEKNRFIYGFGLNDDYIYRYKI